MFTRRTGLELLGSVGLLAVAGRAHAAEDNFDAIKAKGVIAVGCEATYPPFSFRRGTEIVGYDVDVAKLLFAPIGVKPNFIDTEWAGVIPSLYAGRFDIIMSSLSYTKERMAKVAYSIPYAEASQALLIRAKDAASIKSIDDMSGKVLGVKLGSPGQILEKTLDQQLTAAKGKGFADVKTYDDHPAAYLALGQGTVDGVLNTLPTLGDVVKTTGGRFAIVRGVAKQNWAGIAARQDEGKLIAYIDEQLRTTEANGKLAALQQTWFGLDFDLPSTIPSL